MITLAWNNLPMVVEATKPRGREIAARIAPWVIFAGGVAIATLGAVTFTDAMGSMANHVNYIINLVGSSNPNVISQVNSVIDGLNNDYWNTFKGAGELMIGSGLATAGGVTGTTKALKIDL